MTTSLTIADERSAWRHIESALRGHYDSDVVELNFENWPLFHVNVKGDRYDSTLPTSLMRSLVDLQVHLYRVYAEVVYGKSAKSLSAEERSALEIVFKVENGSSNIVADLSGFFSELGKNAMDKMTGTQVVCTVLGVAAIWLGASSFDGYIASQERTQQEANRHQITMALIAREPKLLEIQNESIATYTNLLKSVPDATKVQLQKTTLSQAQIEEITKQERQSTELKRIDGQYFVSGLKVKQDSYKVELIRADDKRSIVTELYKGHLNIAEMEALMKAFHTEKPLALNVVGRVRDDFITSAIIVGVNNHAQGNVVDDQQQVASISETHIEINR